MSSGRGEYDPCDPQRPHWPAQCVISHVLTTGPAGPVTPQGIICDEDRYEYACEAQQPEHDHHPLETQHIYKMNS